MCHNTSEKLEIFLESLVLDGLMFFTVSVSRVFSFTSFHFLWNSKMLKQKNEAGGHIMGKPKCQAQISEVHKGPSIKYVCRFLGGQNCRCLPT